MPKYTIRKYNNDTAFSYAVFLSKHIEGIQMSVITSEIATPVISGLTIEQAKNYVKLKEKNDGEKGEECW